jgi:hypothetical protein
MTIDEVTSLTNEFPFQIPCPPSALRVPPPIYGISSANSGNRVGHAQSPPSGARFPGDRIAWPAMHLPDQKNTIGIPEIPEEYPIARCLDDRAGRDRETGCGTLQIVDYGPRIVEKIEPNSMDSVVRATVFGEVAVDMDFVLGGSPEAIMEAQAEATELRDATIQGDIRAGSVLCEELPLGQGECLPIKMGLRREVPLNGDCISIKELSDLLGIRVFEVLKQLIDLKIFAKSSDSISLEVASKIGDKDGVNFAGGDPLI